MTLRFSTQRARRRRKVTRRKPLRCFAVLCALCIFLVPGRLSAQCTSCKGRPTVAGYDLAVEVPQPKLQGQETQGWIEWLNLFWLSKHAKAHLSALNKDCIGFTQPLDANLSSESFVTSDGIEVPPLNDESEQLAVGMTYINLPPSGDVSRFGNYLITGSVRQEGSGYAMYMELQTSCTRETVASSRVPFQLSTSSAYIIETANKAAEQLGPLAEKIKSFELKKRKETQQYALEGLTDDAIIITPQKRNLGTGEQTELDITLKDCDGQPLPNREIVFTKGVLNGNPISGGTAGGTVTPATVVTDAQGKAKATFKMGSGKTAMIEAYHIYNKPYGCPGVKLGSTPIGAAPVKVEISYVQNETKTLKAATLPGIRVRGGDEEEQTIMFHHAVLYHYPSALSLKDGFIVEAVREDPAPGSRTVYSVESGYYDHIKAFHPKQIYTKVSSQYVLAEKQPGSGKQISGYASLQHPSEVLFTKGSVNEPPSFTWTTEYPASPDGEIAGGSFILAKGDEGVQWQVRSITDPKSPYKTEYIITARLDAAEELKKGDQALKDIFGMNTDEMINTTDPTGKKTNMVTAAGSKSIVVRILSPYADK
jgi:hypothetical protein